MNESAWREIPDRVRTLERAYEACRLCPRQCGVNRRAGETGWCGAGLEARCFREMIGYNEESTLTPSHQLYFSGCNLRCGFCTVSAWNHAGSAVPALSAELLVEAVRMRRMKGARTLNLLGGEPAVNLLGILELLAMLEPGIRVVWNSNLYYNPIVAESLAGLADVVLADFKCGNDECARRLLGGSDYVGTVRDNLRRAAAGGELIVRHLLMPGHGSCCFEPVAQWLASELPGVKFSIRGNYMPPDDDVEAPAGYVNLDEWDAARTFATRLGLSLIE